MSVSMLTFYFTLLKLRSFLKSYFLIEDINQTASYSTVHSLLRKRVCVLSCTFWGTGMGELLAEQQRSLNVTLFLEGLHVTSGVCFPK